MSSEQRSVKLEFPVLVYDEDGGFVAHSLLTNTVFWSEDADGALQGLCESLDILFHGVLDDFGSMPSVEAIIGRMGGQALRELFAIWHSLKEPGPDMLRNSCGPKTETSGLRGFSPLADFGILPKRSIPPSEMLLA